MCVCVSMCLSTYLPLRTPRPSSFKHTSTDANHVEECTTNMTAVAVAVVSGDANGGGGGFGGNDRGGNVGNVGNGDNGGDGSGGAAASASAADSAAAAAATDAAGAASTTPTQLYQSTYYRLLLVRPPTISQPTPAYYQSPSQAARHMTHADLYSIDNIWGRPL